jgi:4-amino-4-deoxy-L-arabinose transferase-like glycosyltransferase
MCGQLEDPSLNSRLAWLRRPFGLGLALFVSSLILRFACFALFPYPAYPDSFYYTAVARSLASGHGLSINYLWNFVEVGSVVPAHGVLPMASNAHWMPLASIIQVPFIWVLGPIDFASALPFMLLGAVLAPLTYAFVRDMARPHIRDLGWPAVLAGILAASTGFTITFLSQADNFALYAVLVIPVLWIVGRLLRGDPGIVLRGRAFGPRISLALAGVASGLAFLSRNDGVLLPIAVGLVWLGCAVQAHRHHTKPAFSFGALFIYGIVALAVVIPWLIRQEMVFGALSPSANTGRILWIRYYQQLFAADGTIGPGYLLSWGWQNLLASRGEALLNVFELLAFELMFFVGPLFAFTGLRRNIGSVGLRPYLAWAGIFIAWSVIFAAPHLTSGNFIHSAVAMLPLLYLLTVDGLAGFVEHFCARFRRFNPENIRNKTIFTAVCALVMFSIGFSFLAPPQWAAYRASYVDAIAAINAHGGAGQTIMAADPGLVWSIDPDASAIQTPTADPPIAHELDILHAAASAYGARWLIIDRQHVVAGLSDVIRGTVHPDWLAATPIYVKPNSDPKATGSAAAVPDIEVFEILYPAAAAP